MFWNHVGQWYARFTVEISALHKWSLDPTGVVRPHPPLHRAMLITKRALEAAGHIGI